MLLCELEFCPRWVLCYPAKCGPFNVIKAHSEVSSTAAHLDICALCVSESRTYSSEDTTTVTPREPRLLTSLSVP